jgi:hypothetical protein
MERKKMKTSIKIMLLLFVTTIILMPLCIAYEPNGATPPSQGDLIAFDIIREWGEEDWCYCYIKIQNNDPNLTVTNNFYVQLRQDSKTGRYLGEVYVSEDLSPAESYTTDVIAFEWAPGGHRLYAEVDWRRNVPETNELNNWYDDWFSSSGS